MRDLVGSESVVAWWGVFVSFAVCQALHGLGLIADVRRRAFRFPVRALRKVGGVSAFDRRAGVHQAHRWRRMFGLACAHWGFTSVKTRAGQWPNLHVHAWGQGG